MLNKRILVLIFLLVFLPLVGCFPGPSNETPIITSVPITTATVGEAYTYDVNATDPDDDTLTYSLTVKPTGMIINSATGLIEWTPAAEGDYDVVVKVSDGTLDITQSFTIVVIEEEGPGWTPTPTPPEVKLTSIVVVPKTMTLFVGGSEPIISVTAHYSDGSTFVIDQQGEDYGCGSSDGSIATVDVTGLVTAIAEGTATITVSYVDKTDTIEVTVNPKTYTITATAGPVGSISPSGNVTVNEGSDQTFTITPDTIFYGIEDVLVDGISVTAVGTYTFVNVTEDHTIEATFILLGPVYNQTRYIHYNIIQVAINAANAGDTILVMAGLYPENVVIPHTKAGLQLIGSGSDVTSIAPVSGRAVELGGDYGLVDGIRIQGFTLETADLNYAFIACSGTVVLPSTTNLKLEDIVIDGGQRGISLNAAQGVTFNDVHISTVGTWGDGALEMTGVSDFIFTNGSLVGNYIGIRLQVSPASPPYGPNANVHIHDSVLSGNVTAVENQDASTIIDATNNWWGDSSGPYNATTNPFGLGNAVSDFVNYGTY